MAGGLLEQVFQPLLNPDNFDPVLPITMGASPFTYTASQRGCLFLVGGTLTSVKYQRGATQLTIGTATGGNMIEMNNGDKVIVAFALGFAPVLTFLPR